VATAAVQPSLRAEENGPDQRSALRSTETPMRAISSAGKRIASEQSLIEAIQFADRLAGGRRTGRHRTNAHHAGRLQRLPMPTERWRSRFEEAGPVAALAGCPAVRNGSGSIGRGTQPIAFRLPVLFR
jgi:hypothetical protein